jgi:hypothetical protein
MNANIDGKVGFVEIANIPFRVTDWDAVEKTTHTGETGVAYWRAKNFGAIRVRMVEYSVNYLADHYVADNAEAHKSSTGASGASLFIVD